MWKPSRESNKDSVIDAGAKEVPLVTAEDSAIGQSVASPAAAETPLETECDDQHSKKPRSRRRRGRKKKHIKSKKKDDTIPIVLACMP